MMRSTFVGSQHAVEGFLSSHPPALYLAPEVAKFGILEWGAYEALFEAGYACARRHLEGWGAVAKPLGGAHPRRAVMTPKGVEPELRRSQAGSPRPSSWPTRAASASSA